MYRKIAKRMDNIAMGEVSSRVHSTASLCTSEDFKLRPTALFLVNDFKKLLNIR